MLSQLNKDIKKVEKNIHTIGKDGAYHWYSLEGDEANADSLIYEVVKYNSPTEERTRELEFEVGYVYGLKRAIEILKKELES
jgi:hypothetical protein